jgi:hypothetical protein
MQDKIAIEISDSLREFIKVLRKSYKNRKQRQN